MFTDGIDGDEDYVAEITRFAFTTECERARVESLTLLDGVSWPTATVILHLFHSDPYPILDFRSLWSVSINKPTHPVQLHSLVDLCYSTGQMT
jgi:hypothetical protein